MTAIAQRPSSAGRADRFLDWAAQRPMLSSIAGAALMGVAVWTALQPLPAAAGCVAPAVASIETISPATLV